MHVMFIHPNFPGQFGYVAGYLATQRGWQITFVTSVDTSHLQLPFAQVNYRVREGPQPRVFGNPASLDELMQHLGVVYRGLRSAPQIRPDLVVGHTFYGTMLYLRNLYRCPFVGYYEYLPPPFWSDGLILRPEFPPSEENRLFNATHHTLTHLHLNAVDAAYAPTHFQLHTAPVEWQPKIRVIFDGVDTTRFQRRVLPRPHTFRGVYIGPNTRVVTYVSRGLESIRGFDIFMKTAKKIYQQYPDVVFLIAGQDRTFYGHELSHIGKQSFKEWVLSQDQYERERFHFLGLIPAHDLIALYSLSDLHVYLTVPYILSWSLMQAMACECVILGSATPPVQEVVEHGANGLLAGFYDVDGLAAEAVRVLRDPGSFRSLGQTARQRVLEKYELGRCTNELVRLFEAMADKR